jgi:hypothetical protein
VQIGTPHVKIDLAGWHLRGWAACTTAGLVALFRTDFDLKIAGPIVEVLDDSIPNLEVGVNVIFVDPV